MIRFTAAIAVVLAAMLGGAAFASAETPDTTISVQPGDGSSVDADGTQGSIVAPMEMARPQIKAGASAAKDGS